MDECSCSVKIFSRHLAIETVFNELILIVLSFCLFSIEFKRMKLRLYVSVKPLFQSSQKLVRSSLRTGFCDDWKRGLMMYCGIYASGLYFRDLSFWKMQRKREACSSMLFVKEQKACLNKLLFSYCTSLAIRRYICRRNENCKQSLLHEKGKAPFLQDISLLWS